MPELPEVQTTVNGLHAKVLNRTFVDVWTDWERLVKNPNSFSQFARMVKGKKILSVWRRAKNIVFELSDEYSLLVHMKMTGHLLHGTWSMQHGIWVANNEGPLRDKVNGYLHLIFSLDDGQMIALSDLRKFAKVELWKTQALKESSEFLRLGPEPLNQEFTSQKFQEILRKKRGKIKQVIMDPYVIAGIGNIYASEALWLAKIHPVKSTAALSEKELRALYSAIKKVLAAGIDFGGDSFSDYRNIEGKRGKFEHHKHVYQNNGKPCVRCKTLIVRMMLGGRGTFYCPQCQKL